MKKNKRYGSAVIALGLAVIILGGLTIKYGFNRLSSTDCTQYEKYDKLRGECYYECDTDAECEEIAKKVDAELDAYFTDSKSKLSQEKPKAPTETPTPATPATPAATNTGTPAKEASTKTPSETKTATPATESTPASRTYTTDDTGSDTKGKVYTVTNSQSLFPAPSADDQKLWDLFTLVASKATIAERLETFEVFSDESNDSAASVWESGNAGKWHMNVNAAFASDRKDMIHTMVHEFGHIVTLNSTQVEKTTGTCPVIEISEGCVRPGTAIEAFNAKFWAKYGGDTSSDSSAPYSDDAFVTEYAASNMVEDLAETFAFFVLRPTPTGSSEKDQKIQFMYSRPELVTLRNRIRASLANEL